MVHIFYVKFIIFIVIYVSLVNTFKHKTHTGIFTASFFIVASKNENLVFI